MDDELKRQKLIVKKEDTEMSVRLMTTADIPATTEKEPLEIHYLKGMVSTRHHVFSAYNKTGRFDVAEHVVDDCISEISDMQCIGIDAELRFYHAFRKRFDLVPALDCGDHTDFVGTYKGIFLRFDVTSNVSRKQKEWWQYGKNHFVVEWNRDASVWIFYLADKSKECLTEIKRTRCK